MTNWTLRGHMRLLPEPSGPCLCCGISDAQHGKETFEERIENNAECTSKSQMFG